MTTPDKTNDATGSMITPSTAILATPPETVSLRKQKQKADSIAANLHGTLALLMKHFDKEAEYVTQQTNIYSRVAAAADAPRKVLLALRHRIKKHSTAAKDINNLIAEHTKEFHETVEALGKHLDHHDTLLTGVYGLIAQQNEQFDAHQQQLKSVTDMVLTLNEKVDTVNEKVNIFREKVGEELEGVRDVVEDNKNDFLQKVNEQSNVYHQSIRKMAQEQLQSTIAQEHANKSDLQRQIKITQEQQDHLEHKLEECIARIAFAETKQAGLPPAELAPAQFAKNLTQVFDAESERCPRCNQISGGDSAIHSSDGCYCAKCWEEEMQ
jgi:chromosome segregation ATPase